MAYTNTVTLKGEVAALNFMALRADVAITGTEAAGVGTTMDIAIDEGPKSSSTTWVAPRAVEIVRTVSPTANDADVFVMYEPASNVLTTPTIRVKVVNNDAVTANGLTNLAFTVLIHFETLKSGGV